MEILDPESGEAPAESIDAAEPIDRVPLLRAANSWDELVQCFELGARASSGCCPRACRVVSSPLNSNFGYDPPKEEILPTSDRRSYS